MRSIVCHDDLTASKPLISSQAGLEFLETASPCWNVCDVFINKRRCPTIKTCENCQSRGEPFVVAFFCVHPTTNQRNLYFCPHEACEHSPRCQYHKSILLRLLFIAIQFLQFSSEKNIVSLSTTMSSRNKTWSWSASIRSDRLPFALWGMWFDKWRKF